MATIPEYQKIVTDLRQCINNVDALTESDVIVKFKAYATAVGEINERLIACGGFIKQGMKAHAIQQAEIEPSLIESVEALDIPEYYQWMQTAKSYGVHLLPIEMDAAKAVNQAYDIQVPLEPLLRAYRKLALQRASLAKRLALLRKISDADPQTLIWQEDLEGFERARIEELKEEIIPLCQMIDENISQENHAELVKVFKELTESPWIEQPPSDIVQKLKQAKDKSSRKLSYEQLKEIEVSLNEAYNELDIDQGRIWRDRWDQTISRCPLDFDDPVMKRAQAALGWIHEEDERAEKAMEVEGAILAIETLLDNSGEIADIDAEIARATKYDDPLPYYLDERVENYRFRHHRRRNQKLIAVITAASLLIIGTAAVGIYLIKRSGDASQYENQVSQIENLIEKENWEAALVSIKSAPEAIQADPRVNDYKVRAQSKLADINKWRQTNNNLLSNLKGRFSKLSAQAEEAQIQSSTENIAPLNTIKKTLKSFVKEIKNAKETLKSSMTVLKGESDQSTVLSQQQSLTNLDHQTDDLIATVESKTGGLFSNRFDELKNIYTPLKRKVTELNSQEVSQLKSLVEQFGELEDTFRTHVPSDHIGLIEPIVKRIKHTIASLESAARFASQVERLQNRMTSSTGYKTALQQIEKSWPDDSRIDQIKDSIKDTEIWAKVDQYADLQKKQTEYRTARVIPDFGVIESWTDDANDFIVSNPSFPNTDTLQQCITFLTPVAKRQDMESIFEDLIDYLDTDAFGNMALVRIKPTEKDFYIPMNQRPRHASDRLLFYHFTDTSFDDSQDELRRFAEKLGDNEYVVHRPAPQFYLKNRISEDLELLKNDNTRDGFENTIYQMLREVLSGKAKQDQKIYASPIVRHQVITAILGAAVDASYSMNKHFQQQLKTFEKENGRLGGVNWVDPEVAANWDNDGEKNINNLLSELKTDLLRNEREERKEGWNIELPKIQPFGLIARNKDKQWIILTSQKGAKNKNGSLHVPVLKGNSQSSFPPIGSVKDGKIILDQTQEIYFHIGRPIFIQTINDG